MRGYFSFILVFVALLLIFTLLSVRSKPDFSKAISIERAYGLSMNVKETIIESARQGAGEGFLLYDSSHNTAMCRHCTDHFCTYDRDFPNYCDDFLCTLCFRENEARISAVQGAISKINSLKTNEFDPDFSITFIDPSLSVFLKPDQLAKNGFSPDYLRFDEFSLSLSSRFISTNSTLPKMVILCH